jgi:tetratricopeptide (TPR) repeat protein
MWRPDVKPSYAPLTRLGVFAALIAMCVAGCSRVGGNQTGAGSQSQQQRGLEEQVRRCATDSQETALEACRNAVRLGLVETGMAFPDSQLFYERIGRTLEEMRKHEAALYTYREAVSRYPQDSQLHYQLGLLLIKQYGAYEEAYGPLLEAVRWNTQSKEALTWLGESQRHLRRYDESTASFEGALRIDPQHVDALVGLGRTLSSNGRAADAIVPLSRAVQIAPENDFAQEQLGRALLDSGRPKEAVVPLQRAVKLSDDAREAYCMLSMALARIGRQEESRQACEIARKSRPSHRGDPVCACQ